MNSSQEDRFHKEHQFREGPLMPYVPQFRIHLEKQHYRKATIYEYLMCVDAFSQLLKQRAIEVHSLEEDQVCGLLQDSEVPCLHGKFPVFIIRSLVRFLSEIGVTKPLPPPAPDNSVRGRLRLEWEDYLRRQRGVSEKTIKNAWWLVTQFLKFRFGDKDGDLSQITATDITRFMQQTALRARPLRDKTSPSHLRNFCLFLFKTNRTAANLVPSVLAVAHRYRARLPRHLTPEQVDAVVAAVKEDTSLGRRNYAMVLLMARLGLRAEEVVAMQLEDIDWRTGELMVRGKGQRHDRLPLPTDVGEALAEYIRRDRATATRSLFVTDRAPRVGFTNGQILNSILKQAFDKTGLKPPLPWVGAHVLRHSLAVSLVNEGSSIEEVADMLRHRSRSTTLLYARLDMDGMRSLALPWPAEGDAQ